MKYLIEYKGVPAICQPSFTKVDRETYIVVYATDDELYESKDFKTIDEAFEFQQKNKRKLTFVLLQEKLEDGYSYVFYKLLEFTSNNKLLIKDSVTIGSAANAITITFDYNYFNITRNGKSLGNQVINLNYRRRKKITSKNISKYETIESFYDLIPRYNDIYLETLFLWDVTKNHVSVSDSNELEAYFLQKKSEIERKQKTNSSKNPEGSSEPVQSNEQIILDQLVGLDKVKLEIEELRALAKFRHQRIALKLPVNPNTLHMVFTGNPGTGKTTVARLLGQIYHDIGILRENRVTEVSRHDLVGSYVGHTAPKTKEVFDKALGGILFIDEAYSLFKQGNDFGHEAIETLLKLMEDNREDIVLILAGYPKEMDNLMSSNPGLKSRFSKFLHFDDYTKDELLQIFMNMIHDYRGKLSEGAKFKIEHLIESNYETGVFSANARVVRNLFDETTKRQSLRLSKLENPSQEELVSFCDKDIHDKIA